MTVRMACVAVFVGCLIAFPVSARVPNDPLYDEQWYLEQIHAPEAWDLTTGSQDVVVAVLDSGVDPDHPDLKENLWTNPGEIPDNGIDDDGNGYVDDVHGWDFVDGDHTPEPDASGGFDVDGVAHGTVVAGLVGAVGNNGKGVAGVAWKVRIMPLRILDNFGSGDSTNARAAIAYAVQNGADVINLSFTGRDIDTGFERAINRAYVAGIPVVAAVGNSDGGTDLDADPLYPACFFGDKADWVIGVAATTKDDTRAEFSNYGSDCVELSAPGENINGLMYQNDEWGNFSDYYAKGWDGTSVAAPLVTGAIALLKSSYPSLTPSLIRTVLQLSADPLKERGTPAVGNLGTGRLNVAKALEIAPEFAGVSAPSTTGVSPLTGETETISDVSPGMFIRSPGFETVYYVGDDLRRHPLWDQRTYFTWNDSWDAVTWVTDATLPTLPLGDALPPKPGVVLIKVQSDPRAFAVEAGDTPWKPTLRELPSEDVAASLYGDDWADYVIDVEPTLFSHYAMGDAMTSDEAVDVSVLKSRISL